jgi:hypothetical protein
MDMLNKIRFVKKTILFTICFLVLLQGVDAHQLIAAEKECLEMIEEEGEIFEHAIHFVKTTNVSNSKRVYKGFVSARLITVSLTTAVVATDSNQASHLHIRYRKLLI